MASVIQRIRIVNRISRSDMLKYWVEDLGYTADVLNWKDIPNSIHYLIQCRELQKDGSTRKITVAEIARRVGAHRNSIHNYRNGGKCADIRVRARLNGWARMLRDQEKNRGPVINGNWLGL